MESEVDDLKSNLIDISENDSKLIGVGIACTNTSCKFISKKNCPASFCKRCCHKNQHLIKNGIVNTKDEIYIKKCPVHKLKGKIAEEEEKEEGEGSLAIINDKKSFLKGNNNDDDFDSFDKKINNYQSTCKILLIGIGADEQMSGYGRHRTTFLKGGFEALERELNMDLERLWKRNLGRDDRCVTDHGKEAWFPFLDEDVVLFLKELNLNDIVDLVLPPGVGDKRILRDAAKNIGLGDCTEFVKRAIQFGTRIAQQTNIIFHGSNRKGKGNDKFDNA
jgi:hypothetical protein